MRTGVSAASAYGWNEFTENRAPGHWTDTLSLEAFSSLQEQLNRLDFDEQPDEVNTRDAVVLRVVDEPWPFPPHYPLPPQPLAALDLLDYPDLSAGAFGPRSILRYPKLRYPKYALKQCSRQGICRSGVNPEMVPEPANEVVLHRCRTLRSDALVGPRA